MEFKIEYHQVIPFTATVEAETKEEALKKILDNMDEDWPFEEEEPYICHAEISEEDNASSSIECCCEHPYQSLEELLQEVKTEE